MPSSGRSFWQRGAKLTVKDFPQIATQIPGYVVAEKSGFTWEETGPAKGAVADANYLPPVYPHFSAAEKADPRSAAPDQHSENAIASVDDGGNVRKLADVEEELIRFALKFYRGQMSQVARKLGIGRSTLYRKLKDYGINPDDPFSEAA